MIEAVLVTVFPVVFLSVLFAGGALFRRKKIDQDGEAPITRALFYASKYMILVLWAAMVIQSWGVTISLVPVPAPLQWISLVFWVSGFLLLFAGRFELGRSFRLGTPKENTRLETGGLFRFSRNPMYLGVYATILATVLYTLNPVILVLGAFVIVVHHKIVLAEEEYMRKTFGQEYIAYSQRVRRYL